MTCEAFQADVSDVAAARGLVEQSAAALGGLDVFVHSSSGGFRGRSPEDVDEALWEEAIGSTLKGGFFCAQAAYRAMDGPGVIVFITDVAGLLDSNGNVVTKLHANAVEEWIENVSGGMKPKLQAALHALRGGVNQIAIGENSQSIGGTELVAA